MNRAHSAALLSALPVALVTAHSAACIANPFVPASSGDDASTSSGDGAPIVVVGSNDGSDGARHVGSCNEQTAPADSGCVVANGIGVFVAPPSSGGDDGSGDGTREHPYATIGFAITHLAGIARVYVCNADYAESVTIVSPGASLFGGLACPGSEAGAAWTYVGGHPTVTAPQGGYALHVVDLSDPIEIQDMAFVAPDAKGTDAAGNGASSIAVFFKGSNADLQRVAISAGSGTNGNDGDSAASDPNYVGAVAGSGSPGAPPLETGVDAGLEASAGSSSGAGIGTGAGAGGSATCLLYGSSLGGSGGGAATATVSGGDGGTGSLSIWPDASFTYAEPPGTQPLGLGGAGSQSSCSPGLNGLDGVAAPGGDSATTFGALSPSGWTPGSGGPGQPGGPGQGGGGGGGRGAPSWGGNGGGAGGCGGTGGGGGHGGGASIALAAFASTLTLNGCILTAASGGNGGNGGAGQPGQTGGASKDLDAGACTGGMGGNGAGGSGGAGGSRGMSVDLLMDKASAHVSWDPGSTFTPGSAGQPGDGGKGGAHGGSSSSTGQDGRPGAQGFNDMLAASRALSL
jgi:hypothetical protein